MKPSDVTSNAASVRVSDDLPYARSSAADPAITAAEARSAETAICQRHNGRIATQPTPTDVAGRVYFCPIGREYWRYAKREGERWKPLRYPSLGIL